jgi:iron complex outermembrane receptor protein
MSIFSVLRYRSFVAACIFSCLTNFVYAQNPSLAEVVVTSSRMESSSLLIPMGVTVITSEEIQKSGARHANEVLRWIAGVTSRINMAGGKDQTLDLRGFGENAASNQVVLVDGVRQNEGDMEGNSLSWIPINMIDRIEIVRGSGSVLYGEGATAGTFNIITRKSMAHSGGSVSVSAGNLQTNEENISVFKIHGPLQLFFNGFKSDTDNHRENFTSSAGGGLLKGIWSDDIIRLSLGLSTHSEKSGLPGGINLSDFNLYPKKTYKNSDNGNTRTDQFIFSSESLNGIWRSAFDINRRLKNIDSNYVTDGYKTRNSNQSTRLGLRTWRDWDSEKIYNRLLVGYDNDNWRQDRDGTSQIVQNSYALYLKHELVFKPSKTSLFMGARRTAFDRAGKGNVDGTVNEKNTSWETGLSQQLSENLEAYIRLGKSFRLPNGDEFLCYPIYGTCPTVTVNMLKVQQSKDTEMGLKANSSLITWGLRAYRHELKNEIAMGPDYFSNINLNPTRRQGVEVEAKISVGSQFTLSGNLAQRKSTFTEGVYAGKTIPFAPSQTAFASMQYRFEPQQLWGLTANWVAKQRISGDFANSCNEQTPSYATFDTRYAYSYSQWIYSATLLNLADKKYYNVRTRCDASLKSIYPEAGRTFYLSAVFQY